ncbi:MAG: hypothetical protein JO329_15650 [Planctomycetaceae bacterium]|nr:hypothetical protein [Planctomycetaceae bacterium]
MVTPVPIGQPVLVPTSLPRTLKPTRSGPVRPATATGPTTKATPTGRPGPLHPTRRAFGLASDLAEARSHRLAGRLHDAPGAGGEAAEVLAEVRRRLAVGPELAELVAEAVEDARAGRRPRW